MHGIVALYGTGGTGTTTLAVSLAIALQKRDQKTLLMDADMQFGVAADYLNLKSKLPPIYSMMGQINADKIDDAAMRHRSGLRVLGSPRGPEQAQKVLSFEVRDILAHARHRYECVVVDVGRHLNDVTMAALDAADVVVVVIEPNIQGMLRASKALYIFDALKYEVITVLNQPHEGDKATRISLKNMQDYLKRDIVLEFAYEGSTAQLGIVDAIPLVDYGDRFRKTMDKLTKMVMDKLDHARPIKERHGYVHPRREAIGVMLVDDLPEARATLQKLLSFEYDIEVLGGAGSGREAIRAAETLAPDIILMDINMDDMDGVEATRQMPKVAPATAIIMLSINHDPETMRRAVQAGAREFLHKPVTGFQLARSIRRVYDLNARIRDQYY